MKEEQNKINDLEKQIKRLRLTKNELLESIQQKDAQITEILENSKMVLIDTTNDLRIINSIGPIEIVFKEASDNIERGKELTHAVYKATKSIRDKDNDDENDDLDKKVNRFINGPKEELELKIIGTNEDEIYLMLWKIIKFSNALKHYFSIIPTNNIVEESKEHFKKQIEKQRDILKQILNSLNEGVIYIDLSNKIKSVNEKAKELFINQESKIMSRAELEGRFFHELFINEAPDLTTQRLEINNEVIISQETKIYEMKTLQKDLLFKVLPWYDDQAKVKGVILIATESANRGFFENKETKKSKKEDILVLKQTLKNFVSQNNTLKERIKELEYNHQWFMKKRREDQETIKYYHNTIKKLYTYLDSLPYPMSILSVPDKKYEFVNKAFIKKIKKEKIKILAKTDNEVFGETIAEYFDKLIQDIDDIDKPVDFKHVQMQGKIIQLANDSGTITHIVRVFEK